MRLMDESCVKMSKTQTNPKRMRTINWQRTWRRNESYIRMTWAKQILKWSVWSMREVWTNGWVMLPSDIGRDRWMRNVFVKHSTGQTHYIDRTWSIRLMSKDDTSNDTGQERWMCYSFECHWLILRSVPSLTEDGTKGWIMPPNATYQRNPIGT